MEFISLDDRFAPFGQPIENPQPIASCEGLESQYFDFCPVRGLMWHYVVLSENCLNPPPNCSEWRKTEYTRPEWAKNYSLVFFKDSKRLIKKIGWTVTSA